jgi:hypothetical protein
MVPKERGRFPTKIVRSRKENKTTRQSTYLRLVNDQMEYNWGLMLAGEDLCKRNNQEQKVRIGMKN